MPFFYRTFVFRHIHCRTLAFYLAVLLYACPKLNKRLLNLRISEDERSDAKTLQDMQAQLYQLQLQQGLQERGWVAFAWTCTSL